MADEAAARPAAGTGRRRRRTRGPAGPPPLAGTADRTTEDVATEDVGTGDVAAPAVGQPARRGAGHPAAEVGIDRPMTGPPTSRQAPRDRRADPDGSVRVLVGGGPSRVSLEAAMRARDVSRPRTADLAAVAGGLPGAGNRAAAARDAGTVRRPGAPPTPADADRAHRFPRTPG